MQTTFHELLATRTNYKSRLKATVETYRYVVFYGCGSIFCPGLVDTWMECVGRPIDYCCDSDPAKWGKKFSGIPCISPEQLEDIKDDCAIFVTIGKFQPVIKQLRARGFPSVNLIYRYDLDAAEFLDQQDDETVAGHLQAAREMWADERSRQVFDTIVDRAIGGNASIDLMPSICEPDQYFVPGLVPLLEDENYVDIGAYDGDTVRYFLKANHGRFKAIHALELDPANYRKLHENMAKLPESVRISTYNIGAWNEHGTLNFLAGLTDSTLGQGDEKGTVAPLDSILSGQPVSFIKMDIEGAEPQALQGAQEIVRNQHPKLAICVYHHISHLWEIPAYIRKLSPDYQLYLRHHTNLEYETVCYAIPPN